MPEQSMTIHTPKREDAQTHTHTRKPESPTFHPPSSSHCFHAADAGLAAAGVMPADPVVTLVVLLQGAMPTAQNLVVLLNLDEKARFPGFLGFGLARVPGSRFPPRPLLGSLPLQGAMLATHSFRVYSPIARGCTHSGGDLSGIVLVPYLVPVFAPEDRSARLREPTVGGRSLSGVDVNMGKEVLMAPLMSPSSVGP